MEMREDKEAILERKKAVYDMLSQDTSSTITQSNQLEPHLSRRQRRAQKAAFRREQKKKAKSLINVPDWLK